MPAVDAKAHSAVHLCITAVRNFKADNGPDRNDPFLRIVRWDERCARDECE